MPTVLQIVGWSGVYRLAVRLQGFKSLLMAVMDQSVDAQKYEDGCRQLMGNRSYLLYTLDKVVNAVLKQLHVLAGDEQLDKLLELHKQEKARPAEEKKGNEGMSPAYKSAASAVISNAGPHHEVGGGLGVS